jgi:hypothetical protein
MGKGSRPRPKSVPLEQFDASFNNIFGKKEPKSRWIPPPIEIKEPPKQTITFGTTKKEEK